MYIYTLCLIVSNATLFVVFRRRTEPRLVAAYEAGYRRGRREGQEAIIKSVRKVIADWPDAKK
jgi:hypothetical protein